MPPIIMKMGEDKVPGEWGYYILPIDRTISEGD